MTAWSYRYRKVFLMCFKGMKYHPGRMVVGIDERLKDLAKAQSLSLKGSNFRTWGNAPRQTRMI